jgi:hypothetical protein
MGSMTRQQKIEAARRLKENAVRMHRYEVALKYREIEQRLKRQK